MHRYFAIMAAFVTIFFSVVVVLGFQADRQHVGKHMATAFFLVIAILFVHSLVIFYLIGSGRAIREAIVERPWSGPYLKRINAFRLASFPWALLAIASGIGAVWVGAAAHTALVTTMTHRVVGILAGVTNLLAFLFEFVQLKSNSRMIAELQRRLESEAGA